MSSGLLCRLHCCSRGDGLSYPVRSVDEVHEGLLGRRQQWTQEDLDEQTSQSHNYRRFLQAEIMFTFCSLQAGGFICVIMHA